MDKEGIINVSMDSAENPVVSSPFEETARREDVIALYTKALSFMDALLKEAIESGEFRKHIPSGHFDSSQFTPFSIPFKITSDGSAGAPFEVVFSDKDYSVLEMAFGQVFIKEKRKQVRRKPK